MKLTIIVPVYKERKEVSKILSVLSEQTSKDFQVILVVDTNKDDVLSVIDKYKEKLKSKLKVVFNSTRTGRSNAIDDGIREAKGTYSIVLATSVAINKTFVENALEIFSKSKADIIEFNATIKEPIKFQGRIRIPVPKEVKIEDRKGIIAYSYFLDFNKFIKTSVLKKTLDLPEAKSMNSKYSINLTARAFAVAKTYSNVKKTLVVSKAKEEVTFNPLKLLREWEELLKNSDNKIMLSDYKAEIDYACYSSSTIFIFALTGVTKNKVLLKKVAARHAKLLENSLPNFFETNAYILRKNKETKFLHTTSSPTAMAKVYKEFK